MSSPGPRRLFDIAFASAGLVATAPILLVLAVVLFLQDFHSPIFRGRRIGMHGKPFAFYKFRSMVVDADKMGVDTTSAQDPRLTPIGRLIRRCKLDELPQFVNVLTGDMSIVGPRPQVTREVAIYTQVERRLLDVRPGITDVSSIVFSDLDRIVASEPDPDIAYNQLVRPWKSRFGLFYADNASFTRDCAIIALTVLNFIWREGALRKMSALLQRWGAPPDLVAIAARTRKLEPVAPPGSDRIVQSRAASPAQPA